MALARKRAPLGAKSKRGGNRSAAHTKLVAAVVHLLKLKRINHWKNNVMAASIETRFVRSGEAGLPDVIAIGTAGRLVGLECKTGTGKLSPKQLEWQAKFEASGALFVVVRSLHDVAEALDLKVLLPPRPVAKPVRPTRRKVSK